MKNDEWFKRIWKEATLTYSSYNPNIFLERLRKTIKDFSIAGVRPENRTDYVLSTGQKLGNSFFNVEMKARSYYKILNQTTRHHGLNDRVSNSIKHVCPSILISLTQQYPQLWRSLPIGTHYPAFGNVKVIRDRHNLYNSSVNSVTRHRLEDRRLPGRTHHKPTLRRTLNVTQGYVQFRLHNSPVNKVIRHREEDRTTYLQ
jgi:hypothetical protein